MQIQINCYCNQCRQYAHWVAAQGNKTDKSIGRPRGDSRVVQVCKNAVTIDQVKELLQLAQHHTHVKDGIYMHRFYAKCCCVPMMNTVRFLGFVGVFRDRLTGNVDGYDGPVVMFPEKALNGTPPDATHTINVPDFWWKLIRYAMYASAGPFDYTMTPKIWGDYKKND